MPQKYREKKNTTIKNKKNSTRQYNTLKYLKSE